MPSTTKIIEIKNLDWLKGKSAQANIPIGGLFQAFQGVDPFEQSGVALPSLTGTSFNPGSTVKFLTNFNNAGTAYVYAQSDTKLYQILRDSPYTITDVTAQITPRTSLLGAISWAGRYVYIPTSGPTTDLRTNVYPVASGSEVQAKAAVLNSSDQDYIPMCVGADGNLYIGSVTQIYSILSPTDPSQNTGAFSIDTGFTIRDMVNDGRYLVIIADNNTIANSGRKVGNYRCRVYFWDMVKTQTGGTKISPDVAWDIDDSYLIAGRMLDDGGIYVFGYNGLYVCNSATRPGLIRPFTGSGALTTSRPLNPSQVGATKGSVYWIDGGTNSLLQGIIYAYGNPIKGQKKIFYEPYLNGGNQTQTALQVVGEQFWVANNAPLIYVQNIGTTRGQLSIRTLDTNMLRPHRYDYTKVVLTQPLASGQSVQVQALSANGTVSQSVETKSYAAVNPKQSLLFRKTLSGVGGAIQDKFEDLSISVFITGGAAIQRVTTYATPLDDTNEEI